MAIEGVDWGYELRPQSVKVGNKLDEVIGIVNNNSNKLDEVIEAVNNNNPLQHLSAYFDTNRNSFIIKNKFFTYNDLIVYITGGVSEDNWPNGRMNWEHPDATLVLTTTFGGDSNSNNLACIPLVCTFINKALTSLPDRYIQYSGLGFEITNYDENQVRLVRISAKLYRDLSIVIAKTPLTV